ncbi:hypothetical protein RP20_CCG007742 [Aedes albopictus]|nr:hypothetical protein RP20_CCG007742 [Aedes albopictus]
MSTSAVLQHHSIGTRTAPASQLEVRMHCTENYRYLRPSRSVDFELQQQQQQC